MTTREKTKYPGIYRLPVSGSFEAVYRGRDKKTHSKTFNPSAPEFQGKDGQRIYSGQTLTQAEKRALEAANAWRSEHRPQKGKPWIPPSDGKQTLGELYSEWLDSGDYTEADYAQATRTIHEAVWKKIEPTLGDEPIGEIDSGSIGQLLGKIPKPAMQEKTRTLLSLLFTYATTPPSDKEPPKLSANPMPQRKRSRTRSQKMRQKRPEDRKRYLTEKELAALLAEMPERYRAMVELMARVGLRPGEAVALKVGKFDPLRRTLKIDTALGGFTKTGETRDLTLPAVVAERLTEHLARFSDPKDPEAPMFPKEDGSAIASKASYDAWARRQFTPAVERAGIGEGFSPNSLRHSAASFAIEHGANVYAVQKMMGHAKASITLDVYGERWDDSLGKLAETLDEAIRKGQEESEPGAVLRFPEGGAS